MASKKGANSASSSVPASPSMNGSDAEAASEASDYFEGSDSEGSSSSGQEQPKGQRKGGEGKAGKAAKGGQEESSDSSEENTPPSTSRPKMGDEKMEDEGEAEESEEAPQQGQESDAEATVEDEATDPPRRPFSLSSAPPTPSRGSLPHPLNGFTHSDGSPSSDRKRQGSADLGDVSRMIDEGGGEYRNGDESPERSASIATSVWRASMHSRVTTGDLSNVILDGNDEDGSESLPSASISAPSVAPPTSGGEVDAFETLSGSLSHRASIASSQNRIQDESSTEIILQRLEAQNALLARDPKSASLDGSSSRDGSVSRGIQKTWRGFQGKDRLRRSIQQLQDARRTGGSSADVGSINWEFWGAVMNDYEHVARTQPRELSRAIQAGIPSALRGMMWQLMSSSKDHELEMIYSHLLGQPSIHEKAISRDLGRTFPQHEYFQEGGGVGQDSLMAVCKAYSLYDEEVGYTQGLQFIVGPLLLNMPDEEAFCVLVRLMKSYDLRSHFTPNMPGLQLRLFQFDRLLEELLPHVFMHLLRQGIKSSMYASQWFLTLFGYRFPLDLVSVVMDLVFAEGVEAVFRFALALMKKNEQKICSLDFDSLLDFLKLDLFEVYRTEATVDMGASPAAADPPTYRASDFVREALQVKITPVMLDQYAAEWDAMCRQQNAHTLELESLRQANQKLSAQVRRLEASLAQINEEHCDLVKQVVMSKLEREELEDELAKFKLLYADLSHRHEASSHHRGSLSAAS